MKTFLDFKNSIQDFNWTPVLNNDDADEAYIQLQKYLTYCF